jgi:hypothetical protein
MRVRVDMHLLVVFRQFVLPSDCMVNTMHVPTNAHASAKPSTRCLPAVTTRCKPNAPTAGARVCGYGHLECRDTRLREHVDGIPRLYTLGTREQLNGGGSLVGLLRSIGN